MTQKYVYNKGYRCYVSGKTRKLYVAIFAMTLYDEGPREGIINLIPIDKFKTMKQFEWSN